jgi:hypothetical protein
MRDRLKVASRLAALFFAVWFVVVTPVVIVLFNAEQHLLSSRVYKQALIQQYIYERFPRLAAEHLVHQMNYAGPAGEGEDEAASEESTGPPAPLPDLTRADYEAIISAFVPADWLQAQTERALDQAFANLAPDAPTTPITISLAEVKARIGGPAGVDAVLRLVRSWPPCTEAEMRAWGRVSPDSELEDLPTCRPPEERLALVTPQIEALLDAQAARILDQAEVSQVVGGQASEETARSVETNRPEEDPLTVLKRVRSLLRWSVLLPFTLMLLVTLFGVRTLKGFLRWWGIPCVIVGLIGMVLALAALPSLDSFLAANAANMPPALSPGVRQAGFDVLRSVVRILVVWIGGEAWFIWLLGFGMLLASYLVRPAQGGEVSVPSEGASAEAL